MFELSNYAVRPRRSWPPLWVRRKYVEYEIVSIPRTSRATYSFSWKTGAIRQEPDGPVVLVVRRRERDGLLSKASYDVVSGSDGAVIGTLAPNGSEWDILDAAGDTIASVIELRAAVGLCQYLMRVGSQDVCRFTWGPQGLTVMSAALEIELLPDADGLVDRSLAIAMGPILEERARLTSEASYRTR